MAAANFEKALETILHHEGGFVNHPRDPGGMTNLGVTKRVWEEWTQVEASEREMRSLTPEKVGPLYKARYWDKVKGDDLPEGLDLCIFDFGVNAGPGRAAKFLQRMIGTTVDGGIGPMTLAKVNEYVKENTIEETIEKYQSMRQEYYESLSTFETFGRGWTRRVEETTKMALDLI